MTEYDRTVEWLYALEAAKGMDFKLERVALALGRLGNPERRYRCLHIAGTNGKGSVAAMLHAMLAAAGYRTGLYTSPHLVELTERIRVGGRDVSRDEVVALAAEVRAVATARGIDLTFFEFLTVMAFLHFARQHVAAAVVEVGLGGRLDATNVVDPLVSVITTIGRDHTQWLGESITAIAAEKGGIIKPGRPLVLGQIHVEAMAVLRHLAADRDAPLSALGTEYRISGSGSFVFDGLGWRIPDLRLGLAGAYQRDNAATALAALATVRPQLPVDESAVRQGLADVRWPGRLEIVATAPLTILDGAHNPDGAAVLAGELPALLGGRRLHLLFAVMGDKEWQPMVDALAPFCASVVVTEVFRPRGAPAGQVAAGFPVAGPVTAEPDLERAWAVVRARAGRHEAILAAGSLFLIGALYAHRLVAAVPDDGMPTGAIQP
jgi:dihydrofolate synthase/folylpolyglutamate synthase